MMKIRGELAPKQEERPYNPPSYKEIGEIFNISHERVRQIEKNALRKLSRSYNARKRLRAYYESI